MGKKTLVLGASLKPERYSNMAVRKLVNYKHDVVAFGMKTGVEAGITIDTELKQYKDLDTITLYLNPKTLLILKLLVPWFYYLRISTNNFFFRN